MLAAHGILLFFVSVACWCGLCEPKMFITKANPKNNLGNFPCLSIIWKRKQKIRSPHFHLSSCLCGWCLGQKLSPHSLATIFDSKLPSPELSRKTPPKLSLAYKRGLNASLEITSAVRAIARQLRGKNCLAAILSRGMIYSRSCWGKVRKTPRSVTKTFKPCSAKSSWLCKTDLR